MTDKRDKSDGQPKSNVSAIWGGRFKSGPSEVMSLINPSIDFDKRFYSQDIEGSRAHTAMLVAQKIISKEDGAKILQGLEKVENEIINGEFKFSADLEDIHMNIEARLEEFIGEAARRMHTARSRNDQVATDFKMWVRDTINELDQSLLTLQKALIDQAEKNVDVVMPGFTHLQAAQPVSFGHHLMAYVEMIGRDRSRFSDCRVRLNECPLGSAALAGTSFPIDRDMTSQSLGFDRPTANSLDAVSDRDFAIEFLSCTSICAIHLSRFSEEIINWTSAQFNFIKLTDKFTTGSSIMPQKRNPDAAELVRGKSGRVIGSLNALLIMMKGLPLAFCKDMQEDKEPLFDAADTLALCIATCVGIVEDMAANIVSMRNAADSGFATATDLADWLVKELNIPFRTAHHITGRIVKLAENRGCRLSELNLAEMQSIEPRIFEDARGILDPIRSIKSRNSYGGTSPAKVLDAIKQARAKYF